MVAHWLGTTKVVGSNPGNRLKQIRFMISEKWDILITTVKQSLLNKRGK